MESMFEWDNGNLAEIGRHGLYPADVEGALADPRAIERPAYERDGEARRRILGATLPGRILVVVFTERGDNLRVVTAWPASRSDQRRYREGL
jgi:uncharacterized DUF497 family protein